MSPEDARLIRAAIANLPADVSTDAHGVQAPKLEEIFAPDQHAAALDPSSAIVVGSRGTGKSFWAGVLGDATLRTAAARAYPRLGLERVLVHFGFTGLPGPIGADREKLDASVPMPGDEAAARIFWWATILRAVQRGAGGTAPSLTDLLPLAADIDGRERLLAEANERLRGGNQTLCIVYDALDTVGTSWPRRRMLTQTLLEVVWATRAWRHVRPKLFLRSDQLDDEALRFVELPKMRTGAVPLQWGRADLYGLLFSRLAHGEAQAPFARLLAELELPKASAANNPEGKWTLGHDEAQQKKLMVALAGEYMASGPNGYKKGSTYDWPLNHLADAHDEVTPRSFLGLMIGAAKQAHADQVLTPDGIRHGLREASKTRVEQLHQEFLWIKEVLAPLAGLLLPQEATEVFRVWSQAGTARRVAADAEKNGYLPPFSDGATEAGLQGALERIGVMFRRRDDRLDMPDLFRVAAKLLKKGATAPL